MDEEERDILNNGLLNYQRRRSDVQGNDLVSFLLVNSKFEELPEESRQSRVRELSQYISSDQGNHFDHDILLPSNAPSRQLSARTNDGFHFAHMEVESMEFMNETLDGLDLKALDHKLDVKKAIKLSALEEGDMKDGSESPSAEVVHSGSDVDTDSECKGPPGLLSRISVAKFRAIMSNSQKSYQVEEIIEDIQDDTGKFIHLSEIGNYNKQVSTLHSVSLPESLVEDD